MMVYILFLLIFLTFFGSIVVHELAHYLVSVFFFGVKAVTIDFSKLLFFKGAVSIKVREPHTIRETISQYNKLITIAGVAVIAGYVFIISTFMIVSHTLGYTPTAVGLVWLAVTIFYSGGVSGDLSQISEWKDIITALTHKNEDECL